MAEPAIQSFRSLLKEIANGLTEQDVEEMKYLLGFPAATRMSTGIQLLREMEKQDMLHEGKFDILKEVLEEQKLIRLVRIVKKFENTSSDANQEDKLTQSWPGATFSSEKAAERDRLAQSMTSTGIHDQLNQQTQPVLQQGVAPPGSYQGNPEMVPPGFQQLPPQNYPGKGNPMQGNHAALQMNPNMHLQGPQNQHQQSQYPQGNASPFVPMAAGFYVQRPASNFSTNPQHFLAQQQQQQVWQQQQQFQNGSRPIIPMTASQPGYPAVAPSHPGGYQSFTGQYQPITDVQQSFQRVQSVPYPPKDGPTSAASLLPLGSSGHPKVTPSKSAPYRLQENCKKFSEEEAGLKSGGHMTKEMNIPVENMDEVAETTGVTTVLVVETSGMAGNPPASGLSSQDGNVMNGGGNTVYQTARMRADSVETNNESMAEGVHPMSQQMNETDADIFLLSRFTGKKLYDYRKVDSIPNGPYQVRIPQGVHYVTTEGAFVILHFNSPYVVHLCNNDNRRRCSAIVKYNGKFAGDWTIDPRGSIFVERPATEDRKFHFVEARRAPLGSGVKEDDPDNGVICVTFTPEKDQALNNLTRGFGQLGMSPETDYFGASDTTNTNDVQRGIMHPPSQDCRVGATILQGNSGQQFTLSEPFQVDDAEQKVISLKLVGKSI